MAVPETEEGPKMPSQPAYQLSEAQRNQLRQLRTEIQDLQDVLAAIRRGEIPLAAFTPYVTQTVSEVATLMQGLQSMEQSEEHGDAIRHLCNILEQMKCCLVLADPDSHLTTDQQLHYLNLLDVQCRKFVFQVGALTIPSRVNMLLRNARPGYYIPFHAVFEDELPNFDDRMRVLNHLTWQPIIVEGGLVDSSTGLIYKYATSHHWKAIACLILVVVIEWLILGLIRGPYYLLQAGFPIVPPPGIFTFAYVSLWGAVLAGVIFHIVVSTTKRMQAEPGRPPVIALGTLFPLINAKLGRILYKLLLTLIGFIGLVFVVGPDKATLLNAFLIGYSLDSVVELFGASIERQASAQATLFQKQLGMALEP
jgi:hypothetical protein